MRIPEPPPRRPVPAPVPRAQAAPAGGEGALARSAPRPAPWPFTRAEVLRLQRTVGNRTVCRLVAPPRSPVQRTLKFTEGTESYSSNTIMAFFMKHGITLPGELGPKVMELIGEGEEHEFTNLADLVEKLGGTQKKDEVEEKDVQKKIKKINGSVGGKPPELEADQTLVLKASDKRASQPLFDVEVNGKAYLLKQERAGKSEFLGMTEMDKAKVDVPSTVSVTLDDGNEYMLMEVVPHLRTGLGTFGALEPEALEKAAYQLARVHVTDVRILNVDRLPWRGNGNKGHLFNVFTQGLSGAVMGLDSEHDLNVTEEKQKDQQAELVEIAEDPEAYATRMLKSVSAANKDKLDLDEKQAVIFVKAFAAGLKSML
jgi:hypothetical protein